MTYSTAYMADETGATPRQLSTWVDKGWLSSPAPGTGRSREWSRDDLFRAKLIMRFMEAGFTLERAARLMRVLAERDSLARRDDARIRIGPNMWVVVKGLHESAPQDDVQVTGGVL